MTLKVCPIRDEIVSFRSGTLGLDRHLIIAKHLKTCDVCRKIAASIPVANDDTPRNVATEYARQTEGALGDDEPVLARIGPFLLRKILGRGGMGIVYEAEHEKLKNRVALKILPRSTLSDPMVLTRFRREWEAVGRLTHENVVRALHADEVDGIPFLAMELIDGPDLGKVVHRYGALMPPDAAETIRQAALGLAHAHSQGVIHRDVKPSNLLLTSRGVVKLLDLGLARFATGGASDSRLSGTSFLGTADYMAPEQWAGITADRRTDIYSLGCVLFFLLTGKPPFGAPEFTSPRDKMRAHHEARVPEVAGPSGLGELLNHMLAKKPDDRPQSATEVAQRLELPAALSQLGRVAVAAAVDTVGAYNDGPATAPQPIPGKSSIEGKKNPK
ncbi:serine/threonine-protein kinase [Limnoglobus roseus]|uniref:serine/threonine-protein kinase n=1 Tax=Limnoglobus roseus TaxID=2598579 RepID=UPI00143D500B|nr:serine/threonine-protein kinase [Limnoglobus roseus]